MPVFRKSVKLTVEAESTPTERAGAPDRSGDRRFSASPRSGPQSTQDSEFPQGHAGLRYNLSGKTHRLPIFRRT